MSDLFLNWWFRGPRGPPPWGPQSSFNFTGLVISQGVRIPSYEQPGCTTGDLPVHTCLFTHQWRIQDFPEGAPIPEGGANLLFGIIIAENHMTIKKMHWEGATCRPRSTHWCEPRAVCGSYFDPGLSSQKGWSTWLQPTVQFSQKMMKIWSATLHTWSRGKCFLCQKTSVPNKSETQVCFESCLAEMDVTCKHADRRCINTHCLSADIIYLMINLKLKGLLPNGSESSVEFIQTLLGNFSANITTAIDMEFPESERVVNHDSWIFFLKLAKYRVDNHPPQT